MDYFTIIKEVRKLTSFKECNALLDTLNLKEETGKKEYLNWKEKQSEEVKEFIYQVKLYMLTLNAKERYQQALIENDIDESIVSLISNLQRHNVSTDFCCSGLINEHKNKHKISTCAYLSILFPLDINKEQRNNYVKTLRVSLGKSKWNLELISKLHNHEHVGMVFRSKASNKRDILADWSKLEKTLLEITP